MDLIVLQEGAAIDAVLNGERPPLGFHGMLLQPCVGLGIVRAVDEMILFALVHGDAELAGHVVLHAVLVAVQVVRRDVEQHSDIRTELHDAIELETAQLKHVIRVVAIGDEPGETGAHVAAHGHIQSGFVQDVMREQGGGGLTVTSGDRDDPTVAIAVREFDLADDRDPLFARCYHERGTIRDAGALHDLVRLQHTGRGVTTLFESDIVRLQFFPVRRLDRTHVAHEHIQPALLRQTCSTDTAFLCTEHNKPVTLSLSKGHRSFSVTMDNTASMIPTIQKRLTILLSWIPFFW